MLDLDIKTDDLMKGLLGEEPRADGASRDFRDGREEF